VSVVVALADVLFWLLVVCGVCVLLLDVALWRARRAARRRERDELRRLLDDWRERDAPW
jgi:uncharacterized membrane protein